jgi:hypothetical protein
MMIRVILFRGKKNYLLRSWGSAKMLILFVQGAHLRKTGKGLDDVGFDRELSIRQPLLQAPLIDRHVFGFAIVSFRMAGRRSGRTAS